MASSFPPCYHSLPPPDQLDLQMTAEQNRTQGGHSLYESSKFSTRMSNVQPKELRV